MTKCVTQKKIYFTRELAEEALIDAWIRFEYGKGQGPIAVYQCEDCGYYHLTSRGPMNEKLSKHLADGKVAQQKLANQWLDRIRKKK